MNIPKEAIKLEDNIDYVIIDRIDIDGTEYLYLTNIDDTEDFCVRKVIKEANEEIIVGLDDDKEFDLVLMYFLKKHQKEVK